MRKIAILNFKGGIGKTTTAVNLSAALALKRQSVLVVDCDPQGSVADWLKVNPGNTFFPASRNNFLTLPIVANTPIYKGHSSQTKSSIQIKI